MKISDITAGLTAEARNWLESAKEALHKNDSRIGSVSDGYHTFDELYDHRAIEFAIICRAYPHLSWKSMQHDDPDFPMYEGMFIVGIETPAGQATYHYDINPWWNIFADVPEYERAPEYDGHTPNDVIERLKSLSQSNGWLPITENSEIPLFQGVLVYCPKNENVYMVYLNAYGQWRMWDETVGGSAELTEEPMYWKPVGLSPRK